MVHVIVGTGPPDELQVMLTLPPSEMTVLLVSPVVFGFSKLE